MGQFGTEIPPSARRVGPDPLPRSRFNPDSVPKGFDLVRTGSGTEIDIDSIRNLDPDPVPNSSLKQQVN